MTMPKQVARIRDALIASHLVPEMELRGFKFLKSARVFRKNRLDVVHTVVLDIRVDRTSDYAVIELYAGIAVPRVASLLAPLEFLGMKDSDPKTFPIIGTNVGYLRPPYSYMQWDIWPTTEPSTVAGILLGEIDAHVLPFFNRMHSMHGIAAMIATGELGYFGVSPIAEAAMLHLTGDIGGACERVKAHRDKLERQAQEHSTPARRKALREVEAALEYFSRL